MTPFERIEHWLNIHELIGMDYTLRKHLDELIPHTPSSPELDRLMLQLIDSGSKK